MLINVTEDICLELLAPHHAGALLDLVNRNRPYLGQWLTWLEHMQTVEDFERLIAGSRNRYADKTEAAFIITYRGNMAGRVGLYYIDTQNATTSVGYWLGESFQGKGIMTQACRAMIEYGFNSFGLNRIEIRCAVGNRKSAAIPERLGFRKEGILRQAERHGTRFLDLDLYAMLKDDWIRQS